ncbi:mitotic spindle checkpoint protein Bub3 [Cystobasidiomycetes sp. EMM_F5]
MWSSNCLVSAGWDSTLRLHDPRSSTPSNTASSVILKLPSKAFSMDAAGDKLVIAMAQRHVAIYDQRMLGEATSKLPTQTTVEPFQSRENSLKFMTRSVRCMPNGKGYASSSIEGRVAVEYFDMDSATQKGHFAFKCHRSAVDGVDTVYPVNALAFHPSQGTFATGGGDAVVSIWDPQAKKRLRQLPKYPASVSALSFNADGTKLAIACAVVEEEQQPTPAGAKNALVVRTVGDDCKPKTKA